MIPPSLLEISYYFSWIPTWEDQPVPPNPNPAPDGASTPNEGGCESTAEAAPAGEQQPGGDADGINDVVAMQRIFKGYRLVAIPDYTATAFSGYTHWIENRKDDDLDRGRQDERARRAATLCPPTGAASTPQPDAPDASSSTAPTDGG